MRTEDPRDDTGLARWAPTLWLLLVAAVVVGFDQATKVWAVAALADGPIHVVGDTVRLDLVRNRGGAFSILSFEGVTPLLAGAAIALSVWLVYLGHREDDRWLVLGLALVLGGALGNLGDRIFRAPGILEGGVVDFIDVGAWPTFNLADAAITAGVAVLLLRGWGSGRADDARAGERVQGRAEAGGDGEA